MDVFERYVGDDEIRSMRLLDCLCELWLCMFKRGFEVLLDFIWCLFDMVFYCEFWIGFLSIGNSFDNFNGDKYFGIW